MSLLEKLIDTTNDRTEIINCLTTLHPHLSEIFQQCCSVVFEPTTTCDQSHLHLLERVTTYLNDHLNTGNWIDVPTNKRQAFTGVSFIKACAILKSCGDAEEALKVIDRGFLLGLPFKNNSNLLTQCASIMNAACGKTKRLKEFDEDSCSRKRIKCADVYSDLIAVEVDSMYLPALAEFYKNHFLPEKPIVIKGCMSHWPACVKWLDLKYLLKVAGERTVPIEIGSSYSDENFSQKLMTLRQFIEMYYLEDSKDLGYMAQHDLLNQVPELKDDIRIPEYCCTSRNFDDDNLFEPEINAWFGPQGTVSSLHHDPKDNLLCQVFGVKQVILFAPSDAEYLYAHETSLLSNTAQVDPLKPDFDKYPDFKNASMYKCLLGPGEMLYIPPKWWHHVTALERSFSVNFWWQ